MKLSLYTLLLTFSPLAASAQIKSLQLASDKAEQQLSGDKTSRAAYVDPLLYVNPFIGTGGHGHTFPGAVVPFGMAQVSPDTRPDGWDGCGGYHYSDSVIYGFSQTHLSGTGVPDYADILIVPQVGKVKLDPAYKVKGGYGAEFSHENEVAKAGMYSVKLDNKINVMLTATEHCAIHQYTFLNEKGKKYILIDLGYRDKVLKTLATKESDSRIVGYRTSEGWATEQHLYFDLETSVPFTKSKWISDSKKGKYVMLLEFPENTKQIVLRIGLSGTDIQGATTNLKAEVSSFDAEMLMMKAQAKWRTELSVIQVQSDNKEYLNKLYTSLYHAYVHPSIWSDVDGRYRTFNNTIDKSDIPMYSVFSLWDTYRTANPLYTILQPKRAHDFIESFRMQANQTGVLPVWTLSNNETNCMIGYHSASIINDAYAKGIALEQPDSLLMAMVASAKQDRFGKKQYAENGFISADSEAESVSKTLEYSYDDWCIAEFAKRLGKTEIEQEFRRRACSYLNVWNPETGFFQARVGGMWIPGFNPNEVNHHYTEANAWHYSLAPQHHIAQLVALQGGGRGMERFLDRLFTDSTAMTGRVQADITGLIGQYAQGNEPSHHMAYAYNYCGAPHKAQATIRKILEEQYRAEPDGLSGNEDCGQMSAWFVLSSLGFYPYAPGSPTYTIGSPLFKQARVSINGNDFVIEAHNNSPENVYVQSISWNGAAYNKLYLTHDMLKEGGILTLEMGAKPELKMTMSRLDLNEVAPKDFVPVPYFTNKTLVFDDQISVGMDKLPLETGDIYYSVDNGEFKELSLGESVTLTKTSTLRAKVIRNEGNVISESKIVSATFTKFVPAGEIMTLSKYENQYAGDGQQTLMNGQIGTNEYRSTEYQGYNGKDLVAVIELKEPQTINSVSLGVMQDTRSWIFAPKSMQIEVSSDGKTYKKVGFVKSTIAATDERGMRHQLVVECAPMEASFIRLTAVNFGPCPSWHLGAGNPTWIFADEIEIK